MTTKQLIAALKKHQRAMAKTRDDLRDVVSQAHELIEDSVEADENLGNAIEYLSRNV